MRLGEVLRPLLPSAERGTVIALVGAGGKTRALFGLAEEFSAAGHDVVMTTTTHIFDPRRERGRPFDQVVLEPAWTEPPGTKTPDQDAFAEAAVQPGRGRRIVLASSEVPALGKLRGVHPAWIGMLAGFVLVEADGARCLPVKAPGPHEPVIPESADVVLGLVGLDGLEQPMDAATVHRHEAFSTVTGCTPGAPIRIPHIAALARSPQGLFKGAPTHARRVLVLNKADRCPMTPGDILRELCAGEPLGIDLVLVCTLWAPDPEMRVLAQTHPVEACPRCR